MNSAAVERVSAPLESTDGRVIAHVWVDFDADGNVVDDGIENTKLMTPADATNVTTNDIFYSLELAKRHGRHPAPSMVIEEVVEISEKHKSKLWIAGGALLAYALGKKLVYPAVFTAGALLLTNRSEGE